MNSRRLATAVLVAVLALAAAPVAHGAIDYSKNSVSGEYAPPVVHPADTGSATADSAFAWGDAAVGAGAALVLVLLASMIRGAAGGSRSRRELTATAVGAADHVASSGDCMP
jgi:hypothetical protein